MWFASWSSVARILLVGAAAYVFLVTTVRVSGKRSLSQLNAFDFVVTVALGSTLATILLDRNVTLADGATAFVLLAGLQFVVAWLSVRWSLLRRTVTAQPAILVSDGVIDQEALRKARVTESQIMQAVRSSGFGHIGLIGAVVLEPNGTLSVISKDSMGSGSALPDR